MIMLKVNMHKPVVSWSQWAKVKFDVGGQIKCRWSREKEQEFREDNCAEYKNRQ